MRVTGGRLVELGNSTGPEGRPREGAVADRVQLEVLRPNEDRISVRKTRCNMHHANRIREQKTRKAPEGAWKGRSADEGMKGWNLAEVSLFPDP